jgi:hypothetical protein
MCSQGHFHRQAAALRYQAGLVLFLQGVVWDDLGPDVDIEVIEDEITDTSRWSIHHTMIFKFEGVHYRAHYSVGATESQEEAPFEYENTVDCDIVEPIMVEVRQWKVIGED